MPRKKTYDEIKNEIENVEGLKLITTKKDYQNTRTSLFIKCKCDSIYKTTFENFKRKNKKQCNKCGYSKENKKLEKYKQIKKEIENSNNILLSKEYIDIKSKLDLKCKCGNIYTTTYDQFKRGKQQCNFCSNKIRNKKKRTSYNEIYNYIHNNTNCLLLTTKEEYANLEPYNYKLKLKCQCGNIFLKDIYYIKKGNTNCRKCGYNITAKKISFDYEKVKEIIKNKNCKLLTKEYKNIYQQLDIQCKCGNIFNTTLAGFKSGKIRCKICVKEELAQNKFKYIKKYIEKHSRSKVISKKYINNTNPLELKCKCGKIFKVSFADFRSGKHYCKQCNNYYSKGELLIKEWFEKNNILYEEHFKIKNCKNKRELIFDFCVFENDKIKLLIEYDGIQHFEPREIFGGQKTFKQQKENDEIKNKYCKNNNLILLRIPYYEKKNINKILKKEFEKLKRSE